MGKVVLGLRADPDDPSPPSSHSCCSRVSPERFVCNLDVFVTDRGLYMNHIRHHCTITGPSIRVSVT
jgi:hypothetical protein